ncbi:prolyl oligopeptidase family serine peptidase [uncultured Aquimarina sp.]|uniref:alpha/beta hydrolase n=1 Tax=uncultured Aquimarina sp. TaxID=575652 RepID=UPI002638EDAA|nr:prolyl oligopeptidase family serine peptidase [uncultured Aquimarina sp.]
MKSFLLTIFVFFQIHVIIGQTSLQEIALKNGKFKVGFLHYTVSDSARTYSRINDFNNQTIPRPILVSLWYPSTQNTIATTPMKIVNYFEILKKEEEWEYLPNEQLLNWFYYHNTPANQKHLQEQTTAYPKIEFANDKFPIIIYTPSLHASAIENFALCEYLASNGYIVIASTSRGTESRWFNRNHEKNIETQARDIEFLIWEITKSPNADTNQIALMGFSFGGLSNIQVQMRNTNIKAIVSLDGTERYQYALLKKSPFFNIKKMNVPYIHMAQKDIPEKVLKEDNINSELNTQFKLYDSLSKSKAYRLKFKNLTHSYFSTLGVLFEKRDKRQDKSDSEIMESYKWASVYTLNFLDAFLKNNTSALQFMNNTPLDNGIKNALLLQSTKQPEKDVFTFQDFNELASNKNYENLLSLYKATKKKHPTLELPEGNLNTLGLQLVFRPDSSEKGILILLFATKLYPDSANLFDSLAEAYLFLKNREKAIENFEKSLELNSQNQNAINRLQQLKE